MRSPVALFSIALMIGVSPVAAKPTISPQGTSRVVAVFAGFPDEDPELTSPPSYAQNLFDPDLSGSFVHFYHEMSLGKLDLEGTVLPTYYASDRRASEYPLPEYDNRGYFGAFTREVLENADREVGFGRFDNDGPDGLPNSGDDDGYVDFLFILVKSTPAGFLPGDATGIAELGWEEDFITDDPSPSGYVKIHTDLGSIQRVGNLTHAVGVMAHEFGHALGLPDLYDTFHEGREDDSAGIGNWGLMGRGARGWNGNDGPVPFSAWSREQLGWANVVEITDDVVGRILKDVATTDTVYKISVGGGYYLIENRQSAMSHYDRKLPQDGLLIWHVEPSKGTNEDEENKKVDLVCADGLYIDRGYPDGTVAAPGSGRDNLDFWAHDEYEDYRSDRNGNLGDSTDVFDGVRFTAFTPNTNPSSKEGIWIKHIRRRGTDMIADIQVSKWAGSIAEDVTWAGVVNVVGDIVIEEGATLDIYPGTVVRFSPTDARGSGTDPKRCEVDVFGALKMTKRGDPITFTTQGRGTWVGVRLHGPAASIYWYTNPEIRIEDSDHGIFWSEHPGAKRPKLVRYTVEDRELGNGDGVLNPGETAELVLDVHNWTWSPFRVALYTYDPFVTECEISPFGFGNAIPGQTEPLTALLTVSPDCPEGHRVSFNVELKSSNETWVDTFSLTVNGLEMEHSDALLTNIREDDPRHTLPISFGLEQNVPNPFNGETVTSFELPYASEVTLTIFNVAGQIMKQWQGSWAAGRHHLTWNGQDEAGINVASGVYLYRLEAKNFAETRRMTLVR